ncbi:zonular occludens toxin domain-containing protein [Acinetobacter gyllenbergii]|uniref:zonular occludens toxin domain-containing protein n=1 Tax=Acinetobacter gyllenbergii TaxID=134534 RepID=UPI0003BEC9E5|nr:zonular occludens toxin domain-containing protein [Acinetobacter gyllenbergii]ESK55683.1 hypothetical protein F987_00514 [Acinetobacter gyllenbergii NIPH 230]
MIYLLTGAIGTGKTTYAVDKLMQHDEDNKKHIKNGDLDKVRKIYSNISGLVVDHEPLPDDWRTTPKNSILAVDECHKIDIYKPTRKVLHDDERIVALNESRHDGYDFYFITQSPKFLHQHVRGLVNQHFHFHNPMGLGVATVFMWRHGNTTTPDSQAAKNLAENSFVYQFKKDVQQNFKSIEDDAQHTRKVNIPKKVIAWIAAPIVLIAVIVYLLNKPAATGNLTGETFTNSMKKDAEKAKNNMETMGQNSPAATDQQRASSEPYSQQQQQVQTVEYDITKPYSQDYSVSYQIVEKPRLAGCIASKSSCSCYTQQATKIELSQADCRRYVSGDRPFDYFTQRPQQMQQVAVQQQAQNQGSPSDFDAKYQQYRQANNVVYETRTLTSNPVNGANAL